MDCCIEEGYCDFVSAPSEGRVPEFAGVEGGISEDGREKERRGIVKEMESVYELHNLNSFQFHVRLYLFSFEMRAISMLGIREWSSKKVRELSNRERVRGK